MTQVAALELGPVINGVITLVAILFIGYYVARLIRGEDRDRGCQKWL